MNTIHIHIYELPNKNKIIHLGSPGDFLYSTNFTWSIWSKKGDEKLSNCLCIKFIFIQLRAAEFSLLNWKLTSLYMISHWGYSFQNKSANNFWITFFQLPKIINGRLRQIISLDIAFGICIEHFQSIAMCWLFVCNCHLVCLSMKISLMLVVSANAQTSQIVYHI